VWTWGCSLHGRLGLGDVNPPSDSNSRRRSRIDGLSGTPQRALARGSSVASDSPTRSTPGSDVTNRTLNSDLADPSDGSSSGGGADHNIAGCSKHHVTSLSSAASAHGGSGWHLRDVASPTPVSALDGRLVLDGVCGYHHTAVLDGMYALASASAWATPHTVHDRC